MIGGRRTMLPAERRRRISRLLRDQGSISVADLEAEFGISPMTARRDLDELESQGVARRTHGGAVYPGLASHEDSFSKRMEIAVDAKQRLAEAALEVIEPGEAIFIDGSTTAFVAARQIVRENLQCTLLTNSVPLMDLITEVDAPQVGLVGIGGTLRKRTRSFVGPQAVRSINSHFADHAIFSVRGVSDGYLTDPDPLEAEVKRSMIQRASSVVLLVDATKFDRPALSQITTIDDVSVMLAADVDESRLAPLRAAGVDVRRV
jgi:DeoR/GlpR family transcriptional regulator of sugar metabolism